MADVALERFVNVVALLAAHREPLDRDEIIREVPGFPAGAAARARAFERVKETARSVGIEIETVVLPGRSHVGYRLATREVDLELEPSELEALQAALGAIRIEGAEAGLARLGLALGAAPARRGRSELLEAPPQLLEALARRRWISFGYRGRRRAVAPVGMVARWGHAYVAAWEAGQLKTFRLDRLEPPLSVCAEEVEEAPVELRTLLPEHPRDVGDSETVVLRVHGPRERLSAVGADPSSGELRARNLDVVLADVIVHDLELVAPADLRRRLLRVLAEAEGALDSSAPASPPQAAPRRRRRLGDLGERYSTLVTLLGLLRDRGSASVAELAAAAGITREEAVELLETASLCGLPPYSPDVLLEVIVEEQDVTASLAWVPPKGSLAYEEALAVSATLAALREAFAGTLPPVLEGLAERLRRLLGPAGYVSLGSGAAPALATLRTAIALGACVRFAYAPLGRASGERVARPREVYATDGVWYLDAVSSDGRVRTFRLDRLSELRVEPGCDLAASGSDRAPQPLHVVIAPSRDREHIADYVIGPVGEQRGDSLVLEARSIEWAARVVVALAARILEGPAELVDAARRVARLARQRHGGSSTCVRS